MEHGQNRWCDGTAARWRLRRPAAVLVGGLLVAAAVTVGGPAAGVAAPAGPLPGRTVSSSATVSAGSGPVTEYGTVVFVADGDTIDVRIDGVGPDPGRRGTRVRLLAVQAMELYEYHSDLSRITGECHAVEAARRLRQLLTMASGEGRRVRLTARDASSSNLGRAARFVATRDARGVWHDVGAVLVREGMVVPSYQRVEFTRNHSYRALAQAAAAGGVGLWDRRACGAGPAGDLSVRVRWDAEGNDGTNVNGEYVRVTNHGPRPVNLAGWWVRDSATRPAASKVAGRRGYIFPAGTRVGARASLVVRVGRGPSDPARGQFHYGSDSPIFENVTAAPTHLGDGAYLFDPVGNLREWEQYPCVSRRPRACVS